MMDQIFTFELKKLNDKRPRLQCLFRLITFIPFGLIDCLFSLSFEYIIPVLVFSILVFKEYPVFIFEYLEGYLKYHMKFIAFLFLITDEYPAFSKPSSVTFKLSPLTPLNPYKPLYKWFIILPHLLLLMALMIVLFAVLIFSWLSILITGRQPRICFTFVKNYYEWFLNVFCYGIYMVTDQYPSIRFFSLFRG
jgi:hypothetical protein